MPVVAAIAADTGALRRDRLHDLLASAGPGTRQNIDEFTESTARALETVGGAERGKAIMLLNPADPPIVMRNTVFADVGDADFERMTAAVEARSPRSRSMCPATGMTSPPLLEDGTVTVLLEVTGAGDYLPEYAGNLDIMTSAAVRVAEMARPPAPGCDEKDDQNRRHNGPRRLALGRAPVTRRGRSRPWRSARRRRRLGGRRRSRRRPRGRLAPVRVRGEPGRAS